MGSFKIQAGDTAIDVTSSVNSVAVYNLTVDVVRMTKVNGAFGISETPVTIVTSMPCGIKWLSGKEKLKFNKDTHILDGFLRCRVPAGVTIVNTDLIYYNSERHEITDVEDFKNLGVLLIIGIKKIT